MNNSGSSKMIDNRCAAGDPVLDDLRGRSKGGRVSPICFAGVQMALGELDLVFEWLEKAYEQRHRDLCWLNVAILWDPLRSDPRFQSLLSRMGLAGTSA